jgi:hypothetical protein
MGRQYAESKAWQSRAAQIPAAPAQIYVTFPIFRKSLGSDSRLPIPNWGCGLALAASEHYRTCSHRPCSRGRCRLELMEWIWSLPNLAMGPRPMAAVRWSAPPQSGATMARAGALPMPSGPTFTGAGSNSGNGRKTRLRAHPKRQQLKPALLRRCLRDRFCPASREAAAPFERGIQWIGFVLLAARG